MTPVRARPVQLRFHTGLTSEEYVRAKAWRKARLDRCPVHPGGGCGFARHGTYRRLLPPGTRVTRYYCPRGQKSFSLLPDCLASRLPGTLAEVEQVVTTADEASSLWEAALRLRPDITSLMSAVRWVRRRVGGVRAALSAVVGLMPQLFVGIEPTLAALRQALGTAGVLVELRHIAADHLHALPSPVGFCPRPARRSPRLHRHQHSMGPDPPR